MLEENRKFWSFNGVINRRNMIVNFLIITVITSVTFITPLYIAFFINPEIVQNINGGTINISQLPIWLAVFVILSSISRFVLIFPTALRRIRDIIGFDSKYIIPSLILFFLITFAFSSITFIKILYYALLVSLMTFEGKITGQLPKSEIAKFSWGAFWGTWIWGLIHKSYKTLWMIPLFFTTAGLPFMVICGLKGNEWAYKNNEYESVELFHQKQENQAIIWSVLGPILSVLALISYVLILSFGILMYQNSNPQFSVQMRSYYMKIQNSNIEKIFDEIKFEKNEYKFFLDPKTWDKLSISQKQALFESAGLYTANKTDLSKINEKLSVSADIMAKVKIISTFNGETLAKYVVKEDKQDEVNSEQDRYDLNLNPSLP